MSDATLFPARFLARADFPATRAAVAVAAGNDTVSYAALAEGVKTRARQILALDLPPGGRLALLQDRELDLIVTILGAVFAGVPFTVLSRREGVAEVGAKLTSGGFAGLVWGANHSERGRSIASEAGLAISGSSDRLFRGSSAKDIVLPELSAGDEALVIFTSGSSGAPKAVRLSHGNIASNTGGLEGATPLGPDDHLLHTMPLSHTNGVLNQLFAPLAMGARITLLPRFEAADFVEQMTHHQPTIITGVPTMLQRLLAVDIPAAATERLRMVRCGSAPLAKETQSQIETHLGSEVIVSYGQTELTCTSTSNLPGSRRIGSVGLALKGQDVAVLATDSDAVLRQGETGEVAVRGPNVALGYVGGAPFDPTQWVRTGDSGHFDADGYLYLTGRLKEIIIRGGENLSPGQIEEVLLRQAGISAACVCGVPDEDLGEVPVAFVETTAAATAPDMSEINVAIADRLTPAHRLRDLRVLGALPTNEVGKVDRRALERLAREHVPI